MIIEDARFAARLLVKDRGFAITAVLVLGLGIGVNNMMFTLVHAHTLRGLPIDRPGRVLYISNIDARMADRGLSYPDWLDLQAGLRRFAGLGAFFNAPVTVGDQNRVPDRFDGTYVSVNGFTTLGIHPVAGRTFAPEEDRPGAAPVVLLGSGAWRGRYASDPGIVGRSILINGSPATVIGVMPPRSGFPSTAEVWLPLAQLPGVTTQPRDMRTLRVFGRLRDDPSVSDARAEVESLIEGLAREHPDTSQGVHARVTPINERYLGQLTNPAWMAFTAVGFVVLLISCANVANLMLARAVHRGREMAVRASLGATRSRIVGQLLVESAVLAALGGLLGLGVSRLGVRLFAAGIPDNALPYWLAYSMDARVFSVLAAVSILTVFIFGLVPAAQASKFAVNQVLKAGGRTIAGGHRARRWTTAFLAGEFALTVILLSYGVINLRTSPPEVASDRVVNTPALVTASITLPADTYPTPEQRAEFYRRLGERIASVSGVAGVSIASALPRGGAAERRLDVEGRSRGAGEEAPPVWTVQVGTGYFNTLGLSLERGREFSDRDGLPGEEHAIVNQRFVEMFFDRADPIGRRIRLTAAAPAQPAAAARPVAATESAAWLTIVGVSQSIRQRNSDTPDPVVYLPLRATPPPTAALLVRSTSELSAITTRLREEVSALDPNLPLYRVLTMSRVIDGEEWVGRNSVRMIYSLTFIALALSVVGLYAMTAHAVGQRTQEIGVRMALGAQPAAVWRLVLRRALVQVAIGLVAGIGCTIAWDAAFFSGRVDARFAAPDVLIPVSALLALVTVAACLVPAWRATRIDPVDALRIE